MRINSRLHPSILASALAAISSLSPQAAHAQNIVVGANVVNPLRANVADQNAVLAQLHAAGVHVIRCGISADAKGIDFAKRAAAQGIKIELGVGAQYPPDAPSRPYQPDVFPAMWGGHPLSYADPALSKATFQFLFDQFDANNIVLAGIELGNEINWAAFNPEFPLPGEGKVFSFADLSHDPEAKHIAKGFLQYLKILAVLKDVRDRSHLNRHTPIILAGMVGAADGDKPYNNKGEDKVSLPATIAFLRAHGLDLLVDGYGIHTYPSSDHPGDPAAAARRAARLNSVDLAECRAPGTAGGKPCWITEWGFPNKDVSCPLNDSQRALLVQEMRADFAQAAVETRLAGIIYFAWNSDPWSKQVDPDSVYRCGALTEAGRLAVAPLVAAQTADDAKNPDPEAATPMHDADRDVIVGVNTVGVERMNEQQQDAFVEQLRQNGVKTVRLGIDEKYNHFIIRAYQRGIGVVAIVFPWLGSKNARMRPSDLSVGLIWGQAAFSTIDPKDFRAWFDSRLDALEAGGVHLTAFEFGNEINTAGYDGDFSARASGRVLSLSDLNNPDDKEAAPIAAGYRVYLKALAELKQARDGSKLNKTTPIISAGLADDGPPGKRPSKKVDGVSLPATLEFLRQNDMDNLVDGYGVHFYPSNPDPNTPVSERINGLNERAFALCTPAKPCWLTEWGFANNDLSCPIHDEKRVKLFQTERSAFETFVKQGRLAAIIYYNWMSEPGFEAPSIFRCGALTDAGKLALSPMSQPSATPCIECIRIRVGPPTVEQGPGPGIPDNMFTEIQLPNGKFRGFSASATTFAIDGATPSDMGGTPVPVLPKGPRGEYGESGQWINHVERSGNTLLGWAHCETGDRPGMGLKSMALVVSENDGLSWRRMGEIISGTQPLTEGRMTGEGDCTAVNGQDGYYYAYCWRNGTGHGDGAEIVARAPVSDPGPGNWKKYFNGSWSQPGLGGDSTGLPKGLGGGAARWTTTGQILLLGGTNGGIGLQFSMDGINFTGLREPIMDGGGGSWSHPGPLEIVFYQDLLDAKTGSNQLSNSWIMAYMYVQPNEGMNKRYLVFRLVDVSVSNAPVTPQVGVLLARWYNPALHDRWSTTAAVPAVHGSSYKLEAKSGYLMTAAVPKQPCVELEDCLNLPGQHLDHALIPKTPQGKVCESHGYQRSRTAGFVYSTPQPGTQPLYSCSDSEGSHFASNSEDCDHLGKKEALLGYDLKE